MTPGTTPAPIALFVYNRAWHAQQTVEALLRNELASESDLVVFADAARNKAGEPAVQQVRDYLRTIRGFRSISIVEQPDNLGLANSIIGGVTQVCGEHGRVIVVEDDLITSPHFLRFMNDALEMYANDDKVASIHGYWYDVDRPLPETFFLRGASCWGWATWSRAWQLFEPDGSKLLAQLQQRKLTQLFDLDGAMAYTLMLKNQIAGKNNSWAIRWHASTFLTEKLQLSPAKSLVSNIGFDGSGTHCADTEAYKTQLAAQPVALKRIALEQSPEGRAALIHYHRSTRRSLAARAIGRLRRMAAAALA